MIFRKSSHSRGYLHAFSDALARSAGTAAICLAALLLLIPFSTAAIPDFSIFNLDYTHHQMRFRFYIEKLNPAVNGAVLVTGMALAVSVFRFMLVRRSSDAYFALGVRRARLLALRAAAGMALTVLAISIPMALSLCMNLLAFGEIQVGGVPYSKSILSAFFYLSSGFFTLALAEFSLTALVCCMVGTMAEAISFSAVAAGGVSILLYGAGTLAKHLLFGSALGAPASGSSGTAAGGLLTALADWNPALFFLDSSSHYAARYERFDGYVLPPMRPLLPVLWTAAGLLLLALAGFALSRRKAEIAGVSGKSRILNFTGTFVLCFLGFSVVLDFSARAGLPLAVTAASISFILLYFILTKLEIRSIGRGLWKLPVQLGAVLAAALVCFTGGLGYSSRVPAAEEIASARMSYIGSPNYTGGDISGSGNGRYYYITGQYDFTESPDIEAVTALHRRVIGAGKGELRLAGGNFSATAVPYDIAVRYTLKNGRTLTRYYDRTTMEVLSRMLALDDTAAVRSAVQNTIVGRNDSQFRAAGAYKKGMVYLSDSWYAAPKQVLLTEEQRKELLSCIAEDTAAQSVTDRYFPGEPPLGVVMFSQSGGREAMTFSYQMENALVFVTPGFTNTLRWLKATGLFPCFDFTGEIESIELEPYNPYVSVVNSLPEPKSLYFIGYSSDTAGDFIQTRDFGKSYVLSDFEKISGIAPKLRNDYFMSGGGYLAAAKIRGREQYVYKFLPAADAPDYVRAALNLNP